MPSASPNKVIVHPLVLLSAVDHFNRVATRKRVVGILLGEVRKGVVDVTNSFAGKFCKLLSYHLLCFSLSLNFLHKLQQLQKKF